ncbi:MAG: glycosyltransferase [Gemmatimonadaceae bacterium]|nr:glycosyltransferase [Gemmatimonadaceae bacterium]
MQVVMENTVDAAALEMREVTPATSEWRESLIRTVAVIAMVYATYWIWWRWTHTINTEPRAIVASVLLLLAETWAYLNMCMFVMLTWRFPKRDILPPPPGATVDVFITCYDEPLEVLRRTAIGARAIRYPHRTYLLDDGKRDEVRTMTEQLGIGYIRRVDNKHAKSGNLNFALAVSNGDFILQLDADHVPLPMILDRMLGYFNDPKMAVVQSPQDFYNVDSFTHVVNDEGRRLWEENRIFYSLIQPGRDYWNASFFCGSCGILRRSALEAVGGFASQTIIEDMETTMEFHAHGYNSAYHPETVAYGLAPGAAGAYHVQRLRWGQGAMQILRKLGPLTMKGLTLPQRVAYFAGTVSYFEGWQKTVFYLMPLFYFFTGVLPVAGDQSAFLGRLLPYIAISILAFELLSRGTGYLLLSERFTMVRVYTYCLAALAIFSNKKLKFNVTPKGHSAVPTSAYMPQLVLLVLSIAAPIWATIAYHQHWVNYSAPGWGSLAFWMNGLWALWNCYFALYVVRHTLKMKQQRDDHRFEEQLPIQVGLVGGETSSWIPAMTADLNPAGLGFRSTQRVEPGSKVEIELPLSPQHVTTIGEVRYASEEQTHLGLVYMHGVLFDELPMEARDAIELYCTHHSMPMWRLKYRQSIDIMTRTAEVMRNLRGGGRRRLVGLPARVRVEGGEGVTAAELPGMMILEEISTKGARLIGDAPITPGLVISFDVPGAGVSGRGTVRHVQSLRTSVAVLFSMGIQFDEPPRPDRWSQRVGRRVLAPYFGTSTSPINPPPNGKGSHINVS